MALQQQVYCMCFDSVACRCLVLCMSFCVRMTPSNSVTAGLLHMCWQCCVLLATLYGLLYTDDRKL